MIRDSRLSLACVIGVLLLPVLAFGAAASGEQAREVYRIRMANRTDGLIEVSRDCGKTFERVGRVLRPATTCVQGYSASVYAAPGTVAATAVHGIRIKVSGKPGCMISESRVMSIVPREFTAIPEGFGGHSPGPSGIYTDIPTGECIFRNLAPFAGNAIFLERGRGPSRLSESYTPADGDVLVIVVEIPVRYPREITFENRIGGLVNVAYDDGVETIARVERPVRGIGRFDATGYTGVGRVNTNHSGVITISTAPISDGSKDGSSLETRGGFMIQPSRHAQEAIAPSQVMVVGPLSPDKPALEETAPLFSGYIGLANDPGGDGGFRVDYRTAGTDWIPFSPMVGRNDTALEQMPGGAMTAVRIRFPRISEDWVEAELNASIDAYESMCLRDAARRGAEIVSGPIDVELGYNTTSQAHFARLYVDGDFAGITNVTPYRFSVDTSRLSRGEHVADIQALDAAGVVVRRVRKPFYVQHPAS